MPDVTTKTEVEVLEEEEWHAAKQAITEALDKLIEFRTQEGAALQKEVYGENLIISLLC